MTLAELSRTSYTRNHTKQQHATFTNLQQEGPQVFVCGAGSAGTHMESETNAPGKLLAAHRVVFVRVVAMQLLSNHVADPRHLRAHLLIASRLITRAGT